MVCPSKNGKHSIQPVAERGDDAMQASIPHFCEVVRRIEANSWWAAHIARSPLQGFTYQMTEGKTTITHVPTEPLESLLLHVRKLTMNDATEQLHKVKNALKAEAKTDQHRHILDVWQKYWRLAFVMPQFTVEVGGKEEFMTQYRVYDCFINGSLFHSNDPVYNQILHGSAHPAELSRPNLFLQNVFHTAVANLCLAAIGLKRYIDNSDGIDMSTKPVEALDFIWKRRNVTEMDEAYREASSNIQAAGGASNCRWA